MKFTINRKALAEALKEVKKTVGKNYTIESLNDKVYFETSDKGLSVTTRKFDNAQIFYFDYFDFQLDGVEKGSSFLASYSTLEKIVKKLDDTHVILTVGEENTLSVKTDKDNFDLGFSKIIEPLDVIRPNAVETEIKANTNELTKAVASTLKSVSKQESRPMLTGIHMKVADNVLKLVATDSHRLTENWINVENESGAEIEAIVTGSNLKNLVADLKKIKSDTDTTSIFFNKENEQENEKWYIRIGNGRKVWVCSSLPGQYPETSRLIPRDFNTSIECEASEILAGIEKSSIIASTDKNYINTLTVNDSIELHANSEKSGNYTGKIDGEKNGNKIEISFNPDYVIDALKPLKGQKVRFEFGTPLRPFVIKSESEPHLTELITPMRTF